MIVKPDGSEAFETLREGGVARPWRSAPMPARELKGRAGPDFFAH